MYPDLSYILHDIIGTAPDNAFSIVKTFGLLLVFAFIASAYTLRLELKRKYEEGLLGATVEQVKTNEPPSTMTYAYQILTGFLIGFKGVWIVQTYDQFALAPFDRLFSMEGYWPGGIIGALLFGGWTYYQARQLQSKKTQTVTKTIAPQEKVWDITMVAAISGIIGAKLFAIFESTETLSRFFSDPVGTLLSGSGLAIYGGLIVAFIVVYRYVKKHNMPPIHVMDAVAPALLVGYAVGRLGCQFSGDGDWGIVNTLSTPSWWIFPEWLWSYDYPHNVLNRGVLIEGCDWNYCRRLPEGVFPTPIYETVVSLILAAVLWGLRKKMAVPGTLFALYLIMNGVERFFIEKIRVNDVIDLGFVQGTQAEFISVGTVITGIILWIVLKKRHQS
jgi:prolipoprotein diacylglyceryl transferase